MKVGENYQRYKMTLDTSTSPIISSHEDFSLTLLDLIEVLMLRAVMKRFIYIVYWTCIMCWYRFVRFRNCQCCIIKTD